MVHIAQTFQLGANLGMWEETREEISAKSKSIETEVNLFRIMTVITEGVG